MKLSSYWKLALVANGIVWCPLLFIAGRVPTDVFLILTSFFWLVGFSLLFLNREWNVKEKA